MEVGRNDRREGKEQQTRARREERPLCGGRYDSCRQVKEGMCHPFGRHDQWTIEERALPPVSGSSLGGACTGQDGRRNRRYKTAYSTVCEVLPQIA